MGFFDTLGDMARDKIDSFKEDPAGNMERTVTHTLNKMNSEIQKKESDIIRTGEKKARTLSDEQLRVYARNADNSGNQYAQQIARNEMDRRGM